MKSKLSNLHELIITSVDFNSYNDKLLSGSRDSTVKLIDVESQTPSQPFQKIARNLVTCVSWVPQSYHQFVQTSEDKQVQLYHVINRREKPGYYITSYGLDFVSVLNFVGHF